MFEQLLQRVEQRAGSVAEGALEKMERAVTELPGVRARREGGQLIVAGLALMRRWLADVSFRLAPWMPR